MALQIPAWHESGARKQRVRAGLGLRLIKDEFRLAVFLGYRVVAVHCELSKGLAIGRYAITKHDVIHAVSDRRDGGRGDESDDDQALQKMLDSVSQS